MRGFRGKGENGKAFLRINLEPRPQLVYQSGVEGCQ